MEVFVETGGVIYNALEDRWGRTTARQWMVRLDEATAPVGKAFSRFADNILREVFNAHRNPWNGHVINPTPYLQKRSGRGIKSIMDSRIVLEGPALNDVSASMSTGTMTIHETGGVITARRARYLTIPLPAALDRRGVAKKASARDWPNTFVVRTRRGNLLIMQRQPGNRRPIALYLLKTSVRIPARLGMERSFTEELPRLEQNVIAALEQALANPSPSPGIA